MRYDTCRTEVKDATMAMLTLGFPPELSSSTPASGASEPSAAGYPQSPPAPQQAGGYRYKRQGGYGGAPAVAPPAPAAAGGYGPPAPAPAPYGAHPVVSRPPAKPGKVFQPPTLPPKECGIVDFVSLFTTKKVHYIIYYI